MSLSENPKGGSWVIHDAVQLLKDFAPDSLANHSVAPQFLLGDLNEQPLAENPAAGDGDDRELTLTELNDFRIQVEVLRDALAVAYTRLDAAGGQLEKQVSRARFLQNFISGVWIVSGVATYFCSVLPELSPLPASVTLLSFVAKHLSERNTKWDVAGLVMTEHDLHTLIESIAHDKAWYDQWAKRNHTLGRTDRAMFRRLLQRGNDAISQARHTLKRVKAALNDLDKPVSS